MKEIFAIIQAYHRLKEASKRCALATVVHVEGSSYRRPGARMLIAEDGQLTGAISGGCLEGHALKKALLVINAQTNAVVSYDTMDADDAILGIGLGCNGIIKVLIENIDYDNPFNAIELFIRATSKRQASIIIAQFSMHASRSGDYGTYGILNENDQWKSNYPLEVEILHKTKDVWKNQQSEWIGIDNTSDNRTFFIQYLPPPVKLVIVGAGNDILAMVEMAQILGWQVHVVDGRAQYATKERLASCQISISKAEHILDHITIDDRTYFALMTHNYVYDKACLTLLCQHGVKYMAMIGPKKKLMRMLEEINEAGHPLTPSQMDAIFSPAGLDIGAETSEEIALSIISEIQAHISQRQGQSLRNINGSIH